MLKNSNIDSLIEAAKKESSTEILPLRPETLQLPSSIDSEDASTKSYPIGISSATSSHAAIQQQAQAPMAQQVATAQTPSIASLQLATGMLQIFEPPLARARSQLKELIAKQNKVYIDLSAEKFKLDNAEMAQLTEMMCTVKVYREKLIKIKKQMQNIYQRTKVLRKRATHIQACKQKELQRKLQKQQMEESLIGGQQ